MYTASWLVTVLAADSRLASKIEMEKLQKALGGSVSQQSEAVEKMGGIRRWFWISETVYFSAELPETEVCYTFSTIQNSIDYLSAEIILIVSIKFKDSDDCGGFCIPASIVSAAANVNAYIDVPIDKYND